jgi:hypothetical protein
MCSINMTMLTEECSERFLKKLIGRTDIEDGLKRLDKLTQEESRMATAENLKATHAVDEKVKGVADTVATIDKRMASVDDRVAGVHDRVAGVDERVAGVDDQVQRTANVVDEVKRLSFLTSSAPTIEPYAPFQRTNCGRTLKSGSPHRTRRQTTTSHVALITRKPQPGFFEAASFRSGSQQDLFFGSTENVCPILFPT